MKEWKYINWTFAGVKKKRHFDFIALLRERNKKTLEL